MWPFNSSKEEEEEEEYIEVEETRTKEYTEHTGFIRFSDGEQEKVEFDSMVRDENAIVLKNYTGYTQEGYVWELGGFQKEAFMTIPYRHLKSFETIDRKTKEMEYTVTVKKPKSVVEE